MYEIRHLIFSFLLILFHLYKFLNCNQFYIEINTFPSIHPTSSSLFSWFNQLKKLRFNLSETITVCVTQEVIRIGCYAEKQKVYCHLGKHFQIFAHSFLQILILMVIKNLVEKGKIKQTFFGNYRQKCAIIVFIFGEMMHSL